jgi:hypothetical protein
MVETSAHASGPCPSRNRLEAEVRFHLEECVRTRVDGDGVACESLCGGGG